MLNTDEKQFIKNILKFTSSKNIEYISKSSNDLSFVRPNRFVAFSFELNNECFNNMEVGKCYTLSELGVERENI